MVVGMYEEPKKKEIKKVLITGYVRSGTTLLANFLNSQKDCLIYRDFLVSIFRTSRELGIKSFLTPLNDRQKNVLLAHLKAEFWSIGQDIRELNKNFSNLKELYDKVIQIMNSNSHKVVGSKVTLVSDWLHTIINEIDIYVIYIYRDCRDVLLSAKNRFARYNPIRFLLNWKKDVETAFKINSEKLIRIKFEDLILDTENIVNKLSDFLGIKINKNVRSGKDRNINWIDNSSFHDIRKLFDKRACFRWMNNVNCEEVKYCEILIPNLLKKLGYVLSGRKYTIRDKLSVYKLLPLQYAVNIGGSLISYLQNKGYI